VETDAVEPMLVEPPRPAAAKAFVAAFERTTSSLRAVASDFDARLAAARALRAAASAALTPFKVVRERGCARATVAAATAFDAVAAAAAATAVALVNFACAVCCACTAFLATTTNVDPNDG
jgi:hypothetical protein